MSATPRNVFQRTFKDPLERFLASGLIALVRLMPVDLASAIGGWLGRTLGPRTRVARVGRENLAFAFPEKPAQEREAILKGAFDNFGRTLFEFPHLPDWRPEKMPQRFDISGLEHAVALVEDGKPGLFFSGHMGNWEAIPDSVRHVGLDPLHIFYRAPSNRLISDLFEKRQAAGKVMLRKGSKGAREAVKVMRDGGHIAMVVDQKMNDGIAVPFFGRDAMTAPALASFALKFNAPVVPTRIIRTGGVHFKVIVYPALDFTPTGDLKKDTYDLMCLVNQTLEGWIREYPEQWLWMHRRWPKDLPAQG